MFSRFGPQPFAPMRQLPFQMSPGQAGQLIGGAPQGMPLQPPPQGIAQQQLFQKQGMGPMPQGPGMAQGMAQAMGGGAAPIRAGGYNAQGAAPGMMKRMGGASGAPGPLSSAAPNMAFARQYARRG